MNKIYKFSLVIALLIFSLCVGLNHLQSKRFMQSNIKKGLYIPTNLIDPYKMRRLPIPKSSTNYAFLQSKEKHTNIVIGSFSGEEKVITLITDKNADNKVEFVVHWNIIKDKIYKEANAEKYCPSEKFIQMKKDIIHGTRKTIFPNPEGLNYLNSLFKRKDEMTVSRKHDGYIVKIDNPDDPSSIRVTYYFADKTVHGVDLVYEVKYFNVGIRRFVPIIPFSVYCKNSYDPYIMKITKELVSKTKDLAF